MAEKKPSSSVDKKDSRNLLLESLSVLFYISKIFGVIPYSLSNYVTAKQFKLSQLGELTELDSKFQFISETFSSSPTRKHFLHSVLRSLCCAISFLVIVDNARQGSRQLNRSTDNGDRSFHNLP